MGITSLLLLYIGYKCTVNNDYSGNWTPEQCEHKSKALKKFYQTFKGEAVRKRNSERMKAYCKTPQGMEQLKRAGKKSIEARKQKSKLVIKEWWQRTE